MGITVNTNIQSLFAQRALARNTISLQKNTERLSTGLRINKAADDAAGLSISEKMTSEILGLRKAKQNALDGISLIQTTEGGLSIIQDNMQRIRELMVQAANGTNGSTELDAMQREINARIQTIGDIAGQTQYNGINLLTNNGGASSDIVLQTGANAGETTTLLFRSGVTGAANTGIEINISHIVGNVPVQDEGQLVEGIATANFALDRLRLADPTGNMVVDSIAGAANNVTPTLGDIDTMITNLSRMRSYLGAMQNSLESKIEYLDIVNENISTSRSRIRM